MNRFATLWGKLPVILRAILIGLVVLTAGQILTGPLIFANLKFWPSVPWSVPLLAVYMWFFWQYLQGRWWPHSTSEIRRRDLRARPLSRRVWFWAMTAGVLATACNFALHWVVGRLAPLHYDVPAVLKQFPFFTLLSILLMVSIVAGIVEEAACRGYMQSPIERRHGIVVAIIVVSIIFGALHLTDWQPSMTAARMFFIVLASVLYGLMVFLTDSILPGIVLHAGGDAVGIVWIWWLRKHPTPRATGIDAQFWTYCAEALVFGVAAVWAFRRLARVARTEREL
jgi:membrane protease YdiL (CAAX protease family)